MATIDETLSELQPGTRIRLQLKDGSEVAGTLESQEGDAVVLGDADEDRVESERIEAVLLEFSTEGPE